MARLLLVATLVSVASASFFESWGLTGRGDAKRAPPATPPPVPVRPPVAAGAVRPPAWVEPYDPLPPPGSSVVHGSARFTVISPRLIRIEYSPHTPARFHDAGSFFAVNRRFEDEPTAFTSSVDGDNGVLRIITSALSLSYDASHAPPGGGFTPASLSIALLDGSDRVWHHGDSPSGSLHGTFRTLDRVGSAVSLACSTGQPAYANDSHCEEGVVSRDGWAVLDDSMGPRWDTRDFRTAAGEGAWPWVTGPAELPATPGVAPRVEECSATHGYDRFECLWGNVVDEGACAARGCCFDSAAAHEADGKPPAQHMVPWCYWPTPPRGESAYRDVYFFGHGSDYRGALQDYTRLGGKVPLMPRWALGPFFSRWYAYADHEERGVLSSHARNGIPLDVQVLDTDWHMGWTYERGFPPHPPHHPDSAPPDAHAIQWTGWDVNEALLPTVKRLHSFLHARGVATAWNLHLPPYVQKSGGVQYVDSVYEPLAQALGFDSSHGLPILGDYSNASWVEPFFRIAVAPILIGLQVDAAWPDWQQGEWTRMIGLPPTPWLSYLFASSPHLARTPLLAPDRVLQRVEEEEEGVVVAGGSWKHPARSFVLNRWGGLGAHRYPVGFSGDAETTWEILRLQVLITATAANVAFQWSHDIGGFAGLPEPEVMTRWVQLGVFSPILRPHCAGRGGNSRDIWRFTWDSFEIMRDYFRLRARLVPYLATAQRLTYEDGVVPVHPLYYDFPDADGAYTEVGKHQYFFGDDIWVAPISAPAPTASRDGGLSPTRIWFPPGPWIEWGSWQSHTSPSPHGAEYERRFGLDETPIYSRPGAIIPLRTLPGSSPGAGEGSVVGTAVDVPSALTLWVFPPPRGVLSEFGSFTSHARVYDDDGVSLAYALEGAHRWTNLSCTWSREGAEDSVTCSIAPGGGDGFPEMPRQRTWLLRFLASWPAASVAINGAPADFAPSAVPDVWGDGAAWPNGGGAGAWTYAGMQACTWVHAGAPVSVDEILDVTVTFPLGAPSDDALLTSALARKISRAQRAKHTMNLAWSIIPADVTSLLHVAGTGALVEEAVTVGHEDAATGAEEDEPAALARMASNVRALYEGLQGALVSAAEELAGLAGLSGDVVHHSAPLEAMQGLIANALA